MASARDTSTVLLPHVMAIENPRVETRCRNPVQFMHSSKEGRTDVSLGGERPRPRQAVFQDVTVSVETRCMASLSCSVAELEDQ